MGSYCVAGFFRKREGWGGTIREREAILSKDAFCEKCQIKADRIKVEPKGHSECSDSGGRLGTYWDEITVKCPKCKRTGVYTDNHREEDESYYSNEERRAYRKW